VSTDRRDRNLDRSTKLPASSRAAKRTCIVSGRPSALLDRQ
jgi:hypothetical protein